jgi:hypothetical protein
MAEKGIIHTARSAESWDVSGVSCIGETGTYRVVGEMVPAMTSDKQMEKYGIQIPSSQLIWAIATRDYDLREEYPEHAESLRKFLQVGFRAYPNTSTRSVYNPEDEIDEVIHNYKTQDQYSLRENIVGPDNWITNIPDKKVLESFLGTKDVNKINEVSQWINGTNMYIYRRNSEPSRKEGKVERVVWLLAFSDWFALGCDRGPSSRYPAFRVEKIE